MHDAFVQDGFGEAPDKGGIPPTGGPLQSLRLAVKDVFDVRGLRTGAGNPAWRAQQAIAPQTATAVRLLLTAGAQWVGKTVTDELTYSLAGINVHYGTPTNPRDPQRLPGGSSSGSAAAVAAGHADIGLGTDCGGSIRLPASYCGIWGMRPTHGRISGTGCIALAPSFDTVGWFARDGDTLARTLEALAHTVVRARDADASLVVPADILPLLDGHVRSEFLATQAQLARRFPVETLALETFRPEAWAAAFRTLQAAEVQQQFGPWFAVHGDSLGADVRERFRKAAEVSADSVALAQADRIHACDALADTLATPRRFLLMPTVPTVAPRLDDSPSRVDEIRARSQQLLCMAGLAGLPQVSMPWRDIDGAPVGLSVIGGRGRDEQVLQVARDIHSSFDSHTCHR